MFINIKYIKTNVIVDLCTRLKCDIYVLWLYYYYT